MVRLVVLLLALFTRFSDVFSSNLLVLPPPQTISGSGSKVSLRQDFQFLSSFQHNYISMAEARLRTSLSQQIIMNNNEGIQFIHADTEFNTTELNIKTDYSYEIQVQHDGIFFRTKSVYGLIYAFETLQQIIERHGCIPHNDLMISDHPQYAWRGLMIDPGRRFFPVELVENLMDTMLANKLNVLHFHASDFCRFSVESKIYPNLTDSLTGILAGHYSQDNITTLVKYGAARGIRIVPEFDIPAHSLGFFPLAESGMKFCWNGTELYNDPEGITVGILKNIFREMATLFTDDVIEIGGDETNSIGNCTNNNTISLEKEMIDFIQNDLKRTPGGWEEILFNSHAATNQTIVDAHNPAAHQPVNITSLGYKAIASDGSRFYFTDPAPEGSAGWQRCWYNITTGIPRNQTHLLLGGEMSMWTDSYCYVDQCHNLKAPTPVAHQLFDQKYNKEFSQSLGGMIWPRGYVAASAFWNYNSTIDPTSKEFTDAVFNFNDMLEKRGMYVCPSHCACDQLTACGKPYIK